MGLNLAHLLFPQQILLELIRSQALLLSLSTLINVIDPFQGVHFFGLALRDLEVGKRTHLGVDEGVSKY